MNDKEIVLKIMNEHFFDNLTWSQTPVGYGLIGVTPINGEVIKDDEILEVEFKLVNRAELDKILANNIIKLVDMMTLRPIINIGEKNE